MVLRLEAYSYLFASQAEKYQLCQPSPLPLAEVALYPISLPTSR
jgi:hypothetical protein